MQSLTFYPRVHVEIHRSASTFFPGTRFRERTRCFRYFSLSRKVAEKRQWKCNKIKTSAEGNLLWDISKGGEREGAVIRFDSISAWQLSNGEAAYDIPPRISYLQRDDFSLRRSYDSQILSRGFISKSLWTSLITVLNFPSPGGRSFRPPIDFEGTLFQRANSHVKTHVYIKRLSWNFLKITFSKTRILETNTFLLSFSKKETWTNSRTRITNQ